MKMRVPVKWIVLGNTRASIEGFRYTQFHRLVVSGGDYWQSDYVRWLDAQWRRALDEGGCFYAIRTVDDFHRVVETKVAESRQPMTANPVVVKLQQDGVFEIQDGHHRASRQVAEGSEAIEVEVVAVHPTFDQMVADLRAIYGRDELYQAIEHPYFASWKVQRAGATEAAIAYVKRVQDMGRMRDDGINNAIDLGCCTGGVARALARRGMRATGTDIDPRVLRVAGYLDLIFGTTVDYDLHDLLTDGARRYPGWRFGVCVALSILHHWLEAPMLERHWRLVKDFGAASQLLILDVPGVGETWTKPAIPLDRVESTYRSLLPQHCVEEIGVYQGRRMLAFWRD